MRSTFAAIVAGSFTHFVLAQNAAPTAVSVWFPYPEGDGALDASILGQDATATTMAVVCNSAVEPTNCDFPSPITFTAGPSTFHYKASGIYYPLGDIDCTISGPSSAMCTVTGGIYDDPNIGYRTDNGWLDVTTPAATSTTQTASFTDSLAYLTVTVTAGSVGQANPTTSIPIGSSSAGSTSGTTSEAASTSATRSSGSNQSSSSTSSSAQVPSATGNSAVGGHSLAYSITGMGLLNMLVALL